MILSTLCYVQKRIDGRPHTLMLRKPSGQFNGLGGKMEAGESPEECVVREVKEESGLTVVNPVMRGILTFPGDEQYDMQSSYVFVFVADKWHGDEQESREGKLHWVVDEMLSRLTMMPADRHTVLKWIYGHTFFSGKILYDQHGYAGHDGRFYRYDGAFRQRVVALDGEPIKLIEPRPGEWYFSYQDNKVHRHQEGE